jgi:hypothetical protein
MGGRSGGGHGAWNGGPVYRATGMANGARAANTLKATSLVTTTGGVGHSPPGAQRVGGACGRCGRLGETRAVPNNAAARLVGA